MPPEVVVEPAVDHGPLGDELYCRATVPPSGTLVDDVTDPEKATLGCAAWRGVVIVFNVVDVVRYDPPPLFTTMVCCAEVDVTQLFGPDMIPSKRTWI